MTSYIRVAANVSDDYTRVSEVYAVAFKTNTAGTGPYDGNPPELNFQSLKTFVETQLLESPNDNAVKAMFDPSNSLFKTQVPVGQKSNMIAFIDKVYASDGTSGMSPVSHEDDQLYHVYIYAKNESSFEIIQPSSVTVTV